MHEVKVTDFDDDAFSITFRPMSFVENRIYFVFKREDAVSVLKWLRGEGNRLISNSISEYRIEDGKVVHRFLKKKKDGDSVAISQVQLNSLADELERLLG